MRAPLAFTQSNCSCTTRARLDCTRLRECNVRIVSNASFAHFSGLIGYLQFYEHLLNDSHESSHKDPTHTTRRGPRLCYHSVKVFFARLLVSRRTEAITAIRYDVLP